jgi:hypothetical protein
VDCISFYILYWFYICLCISELLQLYGLISFHFISFYFP